MSDADMVIDARDVTLRLRSDAGEVDILRGVSLQIGRGETVAITGPSGSGKSSLLAVLTGMETATSGEVRVLGQSLTGLSEDALATARRGRVGIVLQAFHLIPTMSALENVAVPLELTGARDAFARAGAALAGVGLTDRVRHYPAQLSGGEQQRVALARALVASPALVFADEPTGNLDGTTGAEVTDLLFARVREAGATLVLITHDAALAARCNRVVQMRDGRIESDSADPSTACGGPPTPASRGEDQSTLARSSLAQPGRGTARSVVEG